jgi:hypothetical protein
MLTCGTTKIFNQNMSGATRGTAGCLLRSVNGGPPTYLLTAGHVLAPEGFEGAVGDSVSDDGGNLIGRLAAATKPSIDGVDAAIVELQVSADPGQGSLGTPTGWTGVVEPDMELRFVGATSGELSTTVQNPEASLPVRYFRPRSDPVIVTLPSHIACHDVFKDGDSGAAVLNPLGQLVGIVIATSDSDQDQGVIAPITTILDAFREQGFDLQPVVDDMVPAPPAVA